MPHVECLSPFTANVWWFSHGGFPLGVIFFWFWLRLSHKVKAGLTRSSSGDIKMGFSLSLSLFVKSDQATISFTLALCDVIDFPNGVVDYDKSSQSLGKIYPTDTIAIFSCNSGYPLIGAESSQCRSTGHWDTVPTCNNGNKICLW